MGKPARLVARIDATDYPLAVVLFEKQRLIEDGVEDDGPMRYEDFNPDPRQGKVLHYVDGGAHEGMLPNTDWEWCKSKADPAFLISCLKVECQHEVEIALRLRSKLIESELHKREIEAQLKEARESFFWRHKEEEGPYA